MLIYQRLFSQAQQVSKYIISLSVLRSLLLDRRVFSCHLCFLLEGRQTKLQFDQSPILFVVFSSIPYSCKICSLWRLQTPTV